MRFAILSVDQLFVENIIVANEIQKEELEESLGRTLMDAAPLGLTIGDFFNGAAWTRNVDGEQILLPIITDSADAEEALLILEGEAE